MDFLQLQCETRGHYCIDESRAWVWSMKVRCAVGSAFFAFVSVEFVGGVEKDQLVWLLGQDFQSKKAYSLEDSRQSHTWTALQRMESSREALVAEYSVIRLLVDMVLVVSDDELLQVPWHFHTFPLLQWMESWRESWVVRFQSTHRLDVGEVEC